MPLWKNWKEGTGMGRNKGLPKQLTEKQELCASNRLIRFESDWGIEGGGKKRDDYGAGGIHGGFPVCIF